MTWPAVFDGIGALVVRCDLDPAALVEKIPGLTWIAAKTNGTDITGPNEIVHCVNVWRSLGKQVGSWVWCAGPPEADVLDTHAVFAPAFTVYDVESPYKSDEGGHYEWATELVAEHTRYNEPLPAAVTSYGGYKTSIDFGSFASASWPILAQVYDSFQPGDEQTYSTEQGGPYPPEGIHRLTRALSLSKGEAVYRPESIDG